MNGDHNLEMEGCLGNEIEEVLDTIPWENYGFNDAHSENTYVNELKANSDLKVLQVDRVNRAYEQNNASGLFKLFLTRSFIDKLRKWTNISLVNDGLRETNENKFSAYVGLELGMSLVQYNDIDEYWKNGMFQGHGDFKKVMSRDDFSTIRSHVKLRPPNHNHESLIGDPLWHSRSTMDYFLKQAAAVAVPIGTCALDENTVRTKARTKAKSYIPNKPQPYGIRFYAVVGSKYTYLHSMFDNGSGNSTGISRPQAFVSVFRDMRLAYLKHFGRPDCLVDINSPTALWILQVAQQVKMDDATCKKRVLFTDNFYTRHTMAKELNTYTDGKVFLVGTVKFTNVDAINRIYLSMAIQEMKNEPRGTWMLVRAYNKTKNTDELRKKHNIEMKSKPINERVPFTPSADTVATKSGYVIWKDSKIVIFYSNDLKATPSNAILKCTSGEAIACVHGLANLERWTGVESLHRTTFQVPSFIVAYNLFMNSVDRLDQRRSTNPTRQVEKKLHMSLFTLYLDLSVHNAYALFQKIDPSMATKVQYREFKRRIAEQLVAPFLTILENKQANRKVATNKPLALHSNLTLGSTHGTMHILLENKNKLDENCFLCMLRSKIDPDTKERWTPKLRTIYGCCQCKKGFHVNCFSAMHHEGALKGDTKALMDILVNTNPERIRKGMTKICKRVSDISELHLKTPEELFKKFEAKKRKRSEIHQL